MATRAAKTAPTETEIFKTEEDIANELEELPMSLQIDAIVKQFAADDEITFKVYRAVPGAHVSKARYIATLPLEEFSEDRLQKSPFNGGDFRVWICARGAVKKNISMSIEPLPVVEAPPQQNNDTQAAMLGIANMMMAGFKQTNDTIVNAIAAMNNRPQAPQGMDVNQTISLIGSLSGLMGGKPSGPDPIALITQVMGLVKGMQPDAGVPKDADGNTDMMGAVVEMVKSYAPVVQDMVKNRQPQSVPTLNNPANQLPLQLPATPMPQPAQVAPVSANITMTQGNPLVDPQPAETQSTEEDDMFAMKMITPMILLAASTKANVAPYVETVLSMATDSMIAKYMDAQDWFEQLCIAEPKFAEHKEWLTQLRDAVVKELQGE